MDYNDDASFHELEYAVSHKKSRFKSRRIMLFPLMSKESNDEKENEDTKNLNQKPDEYKNEDNSSQKE